MGLSDYLAAHIYAAHPEAHRSKEYWLLGHPYPIVLFDCASNTLSPNNYKTLVVVEVETESRASVNTGGIISTSEMSVLLKALIDLSATPVHSSPSLEPTNDLSPCSFTDRAD